ncbi:hypothetical protein OHA25_16665 [Nonomuraea sp. NBC_00507]|uniref:hypothetical protein n=1 Tax=Nonomuraea sp. NBC_00507 TaxID=2976002 RepID=UPI002E176DA8
MASDGIYRLAAEPTDVTYREKAAAGLPAIWANPVDCDTNRVLVYFHGGGIVSGSKTATGKSPRILPRQPAVAL